MEAKTNAKDVFLNLGAIVALYTLVISLVNLLFSVINVAYPQINNDYNSFSASASISWPVATVVIFFPIFILLMWLLEKQYQVEPERQNAGIHRWLTYLTLFLSGIAIAADLITILYYFIDGQELTTGFLLKVLVLFVVASLIFFYYISDIRGKLTSKSRVVWRVIATAVVLASIIWGFLVLGSPRTQRLYKYDDQKVRDLMNIDSQITSFFMTKGTLPATMEENVNINTYFIPPIDEQTGKPYEYKKLNSIKYELCAEFNKASSENSKLSERNLYPYGNISWAHPEGKHCFTQTIDTTLYSKPLPIR
ncbi:hypothetical protein A3D42_03065 [Candidatus Nomurabacteria bacterium RIFCSPHIGHO2_02_FULL_41_18]|uniref:DUF5671 domain-containing protein n=1 Tax=Candidatus Nomurabacteria bacterium RIFCSPHIGHO2_02_FULL_41_18 TaxID=1801754 RepID=A0A1F6W5U7_9BACT|nr:MAG: hypothetical protein A2737_02115 [Candidatus Nomurabacteria bacterium RIFCSPHIGHO2_01_FULL_41_71]OGI77279.1 MAG: hypothetical protein A3D42_03065 [Candidatus Nomurabacteria bacterium RIFCSPHIGHO2_02_FULL_41_18]OGI89423.1 MAG: hypothetical protein A3B01_01415 [Candidatus Nomurabacteria bacterium RIFCSPLOWO2_01_FULL_41_52b]OGJ00260.1 MAG: hypothetical protein A3I90_02915 [Candidatus Nomurabacteria bacterium RIFCSPLOWO2_02_FULL_41_9]